MSEPSSQTHPALEPPEGGRAAALASNGIYPSNFEWVAPPESAEPDGGERRKVRYSARYWLWDHSTMRPVKACGRCRRGGVGQVQVRFDESKRRAGFAGLQSCGSVWVCPVCNAKIMAERGCEIGAAMQRWSEDGGRVAFFTLTLRHKRTHSLDEVWKAVSKTWDAAASGRQWAEDRLAYGVEGYVKVFEVTQGRNGWHVHIHGILFMDSRATKGKLDAVFSGMVKRWGDKSVALGFGKIVRAGQDAQLLSVAGAMARVASYLAKATLATTVDEAQHWKAKAKAVKGTPDKLGMEMTNSQSKKARGALSTRSSWAILEGARQGLDEDVALWYAWEKGSKGKRQWNWSRDIRTRCGLNEKAARDEEIAARELGSEDDAVLLITSDGWVELARQRKLIEALTVLETKGVHALRLSLDRWGVEWESVPV